MLSLILISLKQNTSLLIEAQLKHGGNRKQGLVAPTEALATAGGMAGPPRSFRPLQPLSCGQSRPRFHLQGQRLGPVPVSPMPPTPIAARKPLV